MAERLPTTAELERAFGGKGVVGQTRSVFQALRDEEARGRNLREVQLKDNYSFQWTQLAVFDDKATGGQLVTDWIDFAQLHFVEKPGFMAASQRMAQEDETPLDPEGTNFDPVEHLSVPGTAMVLAWRQDERGFYTGAKLLLFALASVPDGYKILISATWMGPAVRMGG